MKKVLRLFLGSLLLAPAVWSAETVGDQSYTYVGTADFDFAWVSTNAKADLTQFGFTAKPSVSATAYNQQIALDVLAAWDGYGGSLIHVGHGQTGWIALECYEFTPNGHNLANARALDLLNAGYFVNGELGIGTVATGEFPCYTVSLSASGVNSRTNGDNAIAVIATCASGSTTGSWDARVECLYNAVCVYEATVESELTTVFNRLTSNGLTDFSKMLVSQAVVGTTLTPIGDPTALFPWVTGFTPATAPPWTTPPTQVTFSFGTDMEQTSQPIYVGGVGMVKSGTNGWNSNSQARVNVLYGWEIGAVITGVAGNHLESSRGIPLNAGKADFSATYNCTVNSYPPAASVSAFIPSLSQGGGVTIDVDLASLRGAETLWVERSDGSLVDDSVMVVTLVGHTFVVHDLVGTAGSQYHLYEREFDGDIFLRASEGVTSKVPIVQSEPDITGLAEQLAALVEPVETAIGSYIGAIICPDAWVANAQLLADYHTAHGRPTKVVRLSECGNTTSAIYTYLGQLYAEGVRYVLLASSASDHEWFDDPSKWPDEPGNDDWYYWYQDYHTPGGYYDFVSQPSRDLIPMWYLPDTELDNMSYWTPYYATDYIYRAGYPGLRIGRVPAYTNARFLAWVNKDIAYCESGSVAAWTDDVGIWGQCHSWDGNSGPLMQVLIDNFRGQLPGTLNQYALIDTLWTQTQRQTFALADWNAGKGPIYMFGTSSTFYKPIHFFSKANGWNVGQMAQNKYPLLIGTSCGIATHDMALDPTYGDHFATELLTGSSTRGTPFVIGPSRGTLYEGNRRMVEALNQHISVAPALDVGTAFMLAQDEVMASGVTSAVKTAMSYQLLGDPLAPLPGFSATTAIDDQPRHPTALLQNYPNPFNPTTTIAYTLSSRQHTTLRIYNVAGQLVATLVDGTKGVGLHQAVWQPDGIASGVYFYQLRAGSFTAARKMVLLK